MTPQIVVEDVRSWPSEVAALLFPSARVNDLREVKDGLVQSKAPCEPRYSAAASCCSRSHWAAATATVRDHGRGRALFPQRSTLRCGGPFAAANCDSGHLDGGSGRRVHPSRVVWDDVVLRRVFSPTIDLRIQASATVDLHQVTIHMIDGTNLGGPMVTVPRTDLVGQFESTRILGGSIGTFRFHPRFEWKNPPRSSRVGRHYREGLARRRP